MRKIIIAALIGVAILITGMIVVASTQGAENLDNESKYAPSSQSKGLTSHAPIYIGGNSQFTAENGVSNPSAAGTESDPYIIESWDINASSANGIYIENTDVYFIIRNCVVHDGEGNDNYGIRFFCDVTNGKIDKITSYNNSYGIFLDFRSSNNQITNCSIYNNSDDGIHLYSSSNNIITNCTVYNNCNDGILLHSSANNNITNCTVYNNSYGIWLSSSSNNSITNCSTYNNDNYGIDLEESSNNNRVTNCTVCNNSEGIWLYSSSDNNTITNCNVYNNYDVGIYLYSASNNQITNSSVYNNSYGIELDYSSYNNISANQIYNNSYDGIYFYYSMNNEIHYNNIYDNTEYGSLNYNSEIEYQADTIYNWWGSANGPGQDGANPVSGNVLYDPWLTEPYLLSVNITQPENGLITNQSITLVYAISPLTSTGEHVPVTVDGPGNGTVYTVEGTYNVIITVTDGMGNTATDTVSFTIDKTPPIINIVGVTNNTYYNVSITPVIEIFDLNLNTSTTTLNGEPFVSGTTIVAEGNYTLFVQATDKAGNAASKSISFTIDKTLPEIRVTGIADNTYYNISVTPVVDITDLNLNTTLITLNDEPFISGGTVSEEGDYILFVQATDKAGNNVSKTIYFVIDKTNPNITITGVMDGTYYNISVTPVIEFNDTNLNITTITLNGIAFASGTTITGEAAYVLVAYSSDKAGNTASKTISFIIDKTFPIISITSPEEGLITNQDVTLEYSFSDNVSSVENITVTGDESPYTAEGDYIIILTATDQAGNTAQDTVTFIIDKRHPAIIIAVGDHTTNKNTFTMAWVAFGEVKYYEVSTDGLNWVNVSTATQYTFTLSKGENTLYVRGTDLAGNKGINMITVTYKKEEQKGFIPAFEAAAFLIAMIGVSVILLRRRKGL